MQFQKCYGLLAMVLMIGATAHAQTWENPLPMTASPYTSVIDSCSYPSQWLYLDDGQFPVYAPAIVYRVVQLPFVHFPPIPLRTWSVSLAPQGWVDMSLWVCQQKNGDVIGQCVDESDNDGVGMPEHVTIPARRGNYYIIVTGNIWGQPPMCGPYVLTAFH
ncbi:MAG: hypothetical protein ABIW82_10350 [Dokdonella sp.]